MIPEGKQEVKPKCLLTSPSLASARNHVPCRADPLARWYNLGNRVVSMELRYKITNEDLTNVLRLSSRPLWALVLFALLLAAMFAVGIYLFAHDLAEVGWIWLAISVLLGIVVYAAPPIQIRRALRQRPDLQGEIVLHLGPEGIESTFATGKSQLQWRAYTEYKETAHLFVLHTSSSRSTFIPKRMMSPQQIEEMRALLKARIPLEARTGR
jgi:YcxB-like protein